MLDICQKICQCEDVKHQTTSGKAAKSSGSKGRAPLSIAIVFDEVGQDSSWQNKLARQLNQLLARVDVLKGEARAALLSVVERVAEFESIAKLSGRGEQSVPPIANFVEVLQTIADQADEDCPQECRTEHFRDALRDARETAAAAKVRKFFRYECDACGNNTWLADAHEKFIYCAHCNEGTRGGLTTSDGGRLTVAETLNFIQTGGDK